MFIGCLCGVIVWGALDQFRFRQLLIWLKKNEATEEPRLPHAWGLLVDRIRRLQKQLQTKARDSQSRLNEFLSAIQSSPNGVLLLDSQGRIEWCNQTAADHLGIDPQRDLMQHVTNPIREPAFAAYINKGVFDTEVMIPGVGASPSKPVVISIRVHPYAKKRRLVLSRDVTAVQQAEAMRRDFVANVSHEIRTPLTVLSGFVETLQTLPLAESEKEQYLHLMAQQASRMETLVSDLLTLSKLEGSPNPSRHEWIHAQRLVEHCLQEAQGLSAILTGERGGHRFDVSLNANIAVAGNSDELRSALGNLLSNAVRYTPAGGQISVSVDYVANGDAEFRVADTGSGIAPEHIPRLTERFYRVDRSRSRETGGTGLGLAIVKHVIQRHGGSLDIKSQLGQGSVFTLHFPADRIFEKNNE
jgi:two-component system phosphate regulon sensor histidine kinase PhoR